MVKKEIQELKQNMKHKNKNYLNIRSNRDYKTKEESEKENIINFNAFDIDNSSKANI
ncbi:9986_t:CDS:2 [Cetraspora pellucida]|uniref:9986_t:CDS:1 n=1 Tax=Cetraspora pellucida TaxID=1433469 RepID=A0ACA9KLQ9_9GLOM|nr:9986_t:CDS:2 [Cetraspora pellucida]